MNHGERIDAVITRGAQLGREVTETLAAHYVSAEDILTVDPTNAVALQVATEFAEFLETGERPTSLAGFMLPQIYRDDYPAEADL